MSTDEAVDIDAMLGDGGEDYGNEEDYQFSRTDRYTPINIGYTYVVIRTGENLWSI